MQAIAGEGAREQPTGLATTDRLLLELLVPAIF